MRFPDLTALVQPWKIERTSEEVAADLHQLGGYGLAFMPSGTGYIISPAVVNLTPVALPAPVQPKTPPSFSSPDAVAPHTLDALVIALASYAMTHPVRLTVSSRWDQPLPQSGAAIAAVRTKLDLPGDLLSAFPDVPPVTWELALAHTLGLKVIAEGVETEDQLELLRTNGCDEVQGYLMSKPLSGTAAFTFLHAKQCAQQAPGSPAE